MDSCIFLLLSNTTYQFLEIYREETEPLIGNIKHDNKGTDSREEDKMKAISKIL